MDVAANRWMTKAGVGSSFASYHPSSNSDGRPSHGLASAAFSAGLLSKHGGSLLGFSTDLLGDVLQVRVAAECYTEEVNCHVSRPQRSSD